MSFFHTRYGTEAMIRTPEPFLNTQSQCATSGSTESSGRIAPFGEFDSWLDEIVMRDEFDEDEEIDDDEESDDDDSEDDDDWDDDDDDWEDDDEEEEDDED